MLSTSYPITSGSVSGLFVGRLANALSEAVDVFVVAPDGAGENAGRSSFVAGKFFRYAPKSWQVLAHIPGGVPSQLKLNKLNYLLLPLFVISYLFTSLRYSKSVEVVHANWAFSSLIGWCVKKYRCVPLLTTLRGEDVRPSAGGVSAVILRFSLWASDSVVVVSDEMLELLREEYPEYSHKVVTVHNGVSSEFSMEGKEAAFYAEGCLRFISVGSLIARKNLSFLIEVLALAHEKGVNFVLSVVGAGPESEALQEKVVRLGLNDRVSFLGQLPPDQVAEKVNAAHVYVSSSLHEGRPNGVLEAMAAGCCCVLSNISGHRELVAEGRGAVFPLDSPEVLRDLLVDLYMSRNRLELMGQLSHQYIESNSLTWRGCAAKYASAYAGVIAREESCV